MTDAKPPVSTELNPAHHPDQTAMQDESIVERLEADPTDPDAKLDAGLTAAVAELFAASTPPAIPPASSRPRAPASRCLRRFVVVGSLSIMLSSSSSPTAWQVHDRDDAH